MPSAETPAKTVVRRVVIGEDATGKAVLSKLEELEPALGSAGFYGVWGWDETPRLPVNPTGAYDHVSVFPPPGGMRVNIVAFPPCGDAAAVADPEGWHPDFSRLRSARPVREDRDEGGFVRTDTVDLGFVLTGEIVVDLDDGVEVTMRPGDVYVQNGARHAWRNDGDEPCLVAWVVFDAERDDG